MIYRILRPLFLVFLLISLSTQAADLKPEQQKEARTLINLLDYMSKDYAMAIEDGEVINEFEYAEMKEFSSQLLGLHARLSNVVDAGEFERIKPRLEELQKKVDQKASVPEIRSITSELRAEVLALNLVNVTPTKWPNLQNGEEIFIKQCAPCHGNTGAGDGKLGEGLEPAPSSFIDEAAHNVAPLQIYNTTRLGIEGTAMAAFPMLTDQEIWDVAFYIKTLNKDSSQAASALPANWEKGDALRTAALSSDAELENLLANRDISASGLRQFQPKKESGKQSLERAFTLIAQSQEAYDQGNYREAEDLALDAYLEGVEPVESNLRAINAGLVTALEKDMLNLRSSLKAQNEDVSANYAQAVSTLENAETALAGHDDSWLFNFWAAFSIIFREALEALLIVALILSVLKSIGAKDAVPYVHSGWIVAVLIGAGGFFAIDQLLAMGGKNRELMEGIGSLVAVFVLLYVGFWLHSTTKIKDWTNYIKNKVESMLGSGRKWALGVFVFIVVFREAFESVIFLSSLSMGTDQLSGLGAGVLSAGAVIAVLSVLVLRYSQRLPLTKLFKYSALSILILAVVLVGKGVHEFQEAGVISVTQLPFSLDIPLIGFYSSWQTVASQVIIALLGVLLWNYGHLLNRKPREAAQEQSGKAREQAGHQAA